jgi:hypothetical protein
VRYNRRMREARTLAEIFAYLEFTEGRLLGELDRSRRLLDQPVADGRWTIGQIARHLIQSERVMYPMWTVVPKLGAWPGLLRSLHRLNVALWHLMGMRTVEAPTTKLSAAYAKEGRFTAPLFLRPTRRPTDYAALLEARRKVRTRSLAAITACGASTLHRLSWSHPELGRLSLFEMAEFLGIHEEHHLPQIERARLAAMPAGPSAAGRH